MDQPVAADPPDDEHIRKQGDESREALGRQGVTKKIRESSNSSFCTSYFFKQISESERNKSKQRGLQLRMRSCDVTVEHVSFVVWTISSECSRTLARGKDIHNRLGNRMFGRRILARHARPHGDTVGELRHGQPGCPRPDARRL